MTWELVFPNAFIRRLERFVRAHPDLRPRVARVLRNLERDPFQPQLRLHGLTGRQDGYSAVRVTYGYRIVLVVDSAARRIILHDIGPHDEVYR